MRSSYAEGDVEILLNDVTGKVEPVTQEERKRRVEAGEYVRSIIIKEYEVSEKYTDIVISNIEKYLGNTAKAVGVLAEILYQKKKDCLVLVDIARAGIPVGILVKRYIKKYYNVDIPHYSISLVKGLDPAAMEYIIGKHGRDGIQFIDGWTGKGTVANEIRSCVEEKYPGVDPGLAVLSDCIGVAAYTATKEDIYIPHSPLNAAATGLVSITVKNEEFENPTGFHSAIYLKELEKDDISRWLIEKAEDRFLMQNAEMFGRDDGADEKEINRIAEKLGRDKKALNPGINEAARAVLRRSLEKLIVSDKNDSDLQVLIRLAGEKGIPVEEMPLKGYKAVSVANDNYIR